MLLAGEFAGEPREREVVSDHGARLVEHAHGDFDALFFLTRKENRACGERGRVGEERAEERIGGRMQDDPSFLCRGQNLLVCGVQ